MTTIEHCLRESDLHRLAGGRASESEELVLDRHLASCPRCTAAYDQLLQPIVEALRAVRPADDEADSEEAAELVVRLKVRPPELRGGPLSTIDAVKSGEFPTPEPNAPPPAPGVRLDVLEPPQGPDELGRLGKFRVTAVLGRGGMGYVFRAEDASLGNRAVALKVIRLREGQDATIQQQERFLREAKAAALLDHRNIVAVYEVGKADNGTLFLAMPLLKGESLDSRLGRPLPTAELGRLASQIADGLAAAHAAGIVHRDIKPSNVWVEPDGTVKVLDFGLAKPAEEPGELTQSGVVVGSPKYMAPEQARGEPVDHRADLFSLGVVLYEMATGSRLFGGSDLGEILSTVRTYRVPPPGELLPKADGRLAELIAGLLENERGQRWPATVREVAERLRAIAAPAVESEPTLPIRRKRNRVMLMVKVLTGVLTVMVAAQVVIRIKKNEADPGTEVAVPEGSRNQVGADGSVTVVLPPTVNPAAPATIPKVEEAKAPVWSPAVAIPADRKIPTLNHLRRSFISPANMNAAGLGNAAHAPAQLVAVLGTAGRTPQIPGDGHTGVVTALALQPNGDVLASCSVEDRTVRLWNLMVPGPTEKMELRHHKAGVTVVVFSQDGRYLASGDENGKVNLWEVSSEKVAKEFDTTEYVNALGFSPDGRWLAAGGDRTVRLFDLSKKEDNKLVETRGGLKRLLFTSDGQRLVSGSSSSMQIDEVGSGQQLLRLPESKVWFSALALSPNGTLIATNGEGVPIDSRHMWQLLTANKSWQRNTTATNVISIRDLNQLLTTTHALAHDGRVLRCGFSGDGKRLATLTYEGHVLLWDWASATKLATVSVPPITGTKHLPLTDLVLYPDGRHVIVSTADRLIYVLRLQ